MNNPQRPTDAGTFACPICGKDTPHYHSPDEVKTHRETEAFAEESLRKFYDVLPGTDPLKSTDAGCVEKLAMELIREAADYCGVKQPPGYMLTAPFSEAAEPWLVAKRAVMQALSASGGDAAELAAADMREEMRAALQMIAEDDLTYGKCSKCGEWFKGSLWCECNGSWEELSRREMAMAVLDDTFSAKVADFSLTAKDRMEAAMSALASSYGGVYQDCKITLAKQEQS